MRTKRLFRAIGDVDSDLIEAANSVQGRKPALRLVVMRWGALAACVALIAAVGLRLGRPRPDGIEPTAFSEPIGERLFQTPATPPFDNPVSPRKFFNWGGYRYAFADYGALIDTSGLEMGEPLGTLEHDIFADSDDVGNSYSEVDGATTFALGGQLYALPGYDPAFRLAVEWNGGWYMAELVANVDDTPIDTAYYFGVSRLQELAKDVWILPHVGDETLHMFGAENARRIVEILFAAEPADMTDMRYEALASAQAEGRSWRLSLRLVDDTAVNFYIIPDMELISIGDSYYRLPDEFAIEYGDAFTALPQQLLPAF